MDEYILKLDKGQYKTITQSLELAESEFGGGYFINLQHELIEVHGDPSEPRIKHKDDGSPSQAAKFNTR